MNEHTIKKHFNINEARKDICMDGSPYTGELGQISQWAWRMAYNQFPIGACVDLQDWHKKASQCAIDQALFELSEKGLIDMTLNDEGEVVFGLRPESS